jgi:4-carboxymuconolactone decarboxylase
MARVPLITGKDQVAPEHHPIVDQIVGSRGSLQGPFAVFLHSPEIAARIAHLGTLVRFEGTLDFRVRTLAAMVVARTFDAEYVWGAQTGAARQRGIPEATIAAIRENRSDGIPPDDLAIVEYTRTLLTRHRVPDAMDKPLRDRFGNDQMIQLTGAIGYYSLLCMTVNAHEMPAGPGMERLPL